MPMISKRIPRLCGQPAAVVDGAGGGIRAGHADGQHVFRAQRICGDGCHQRRIDAAAEPDQRFAESALAHIIARAQHQGVIGRRGIVLFAASGITGALNGSTETRSSSKEAAWAISSPRASRASEEPSKIRLSLPPTWLHSSTGMPSRRAMAASISRRMARLPCQKGDEERLMCTAGCWRISSSMGSTCVKPPRPEVLVVPGVFADGDGQPDAVQLDHLLRLWMGQSSAARRRHRRTAADACAARAEPARRPARLLRSRPALPRLRLGRQGHACQHGGGQLAGGCGQLINCSAATGQEARFLKEVGRRITADRQFGKHREPRALGGGATAGGDNLFKIPGEISDSWIDLGECDLHTPSLIPWRRRSSFSRELVRAQAELVARS